MQPRRLAVFLACTTVFAGAAYACGGQIDQDSSLSNTAKSQRGSNDDDDSTDGNRKKATPPPATGANPSAPTSSPPSPPARRCEYYGGSSSGAPDNGPGTTSYCQSSSFYECDGRKTELTCDCKFLDGVGKGACSCDGLSFGFECTNGCQPGPEVYAKCNLPRPFFGGTSGGSSSSGG